MDYYYTVGEHGSPTLETAPHGYMWRQPGWINEWRGGFVGQAPNVEWYPLPAPPTEKAPAPKKWGTVASPVESGGVRLTYKGNTYMPDEVGEAAEARLNWPGPDWEGFEEWVNSYFFHEPEANETSCLVIRNARKYLSPPEVP